MANRLQAYVRFEPSIHAEHNLGAVLNASVEFGGRPFLYGTRFDSANEAAYWNKHDANIDHSVVNGKLQVIANSASDHVWQVMETVPGESYTVTTTVSYVDPNVSGARIQARDGENGTFISQSAVTSPSTFSHTFVALSSKSTIRLTTDDTAQPSTVYWDDILVDTSAPRYSAAVAQTQAGTLDANIEVQSNIEAHQHVSTMDAPVEFVSAFSATHSRSASMNVAIEFNNPDMNAIHSRGGAIIDAVEITMAGVAQHSSKAELSSPIYIEMAAAGEHKRTATMAAAVEFQSVATITQDRVAIMQAAVEFQPSSAALRGAASKKFKAPIRVKPRFVAKRGNKAELSAPILFTAAAEAYLTRQAQIAEPIEFTPSITAEHAISGQGNMPIEITPNMGLAIPLVGVLASSIDITPSATGYGTYGSMDQPVEIEPTMSGRHGTSGTMAEVIELDFTATGNAPAREGVLDETIEVGASITAALTPVGRLVASIDITPSASSNAGASAQAGAVITITPTIAAKHGRGATLTSSFAFGVAIRATQPVEATLSEALEVAMNGFSLNTTQYPEYFAIISVA